MQVVVYLLRQVRFEGNTVSADSTLRQEMRQQEGTWYNSQLVELGKRCWSLVSQLPG